MLKAKYEETGYPCYLGVSGEPNCKEPVNEALINTVPIVKMTPVLEPLHHGTQSFRGTLNPKP